MTDVFLSIDVETASLRTALVTPTGTIIYKDVEPIRLWQSPGIMELSSDNIYQAVIRSIKRLLSRPETPISILAIGVDATASLVLLSHDMEPLSLPTDTGNVTS